MNDLTKHLQRSIDFEKAWVHAGKPNDKAAFREEWLRRELEIDKTYEQPPKQLDHAWADRLRRQGRL